MSGSLTKINIWREGLGWKPTTSSEASEIYGRTVSAHEGKFMCELCSQYATFNYLRNRRGGNKSSYFQHPTRSKYCPEKTTSISHDPYLKVNPSGFSLPIKIKLENNTFDVSIGFLPVGEEKVNRLQDENVLIEITASTGESRKYYANNIDFNNDSITYLQVGSFVAEHYKIDCGNKVENTFWPTTVEGVYNTGSLFDKASGKRLPRKAYVQVGREYLLIAKCNFASSHISVELARLAIIDNYYVYSIKALALTEDADKFFRRFDVELTDTLAEVTQIYPFVTRASHVILHKSDTLWWHKTEGHIDTCPGDEKIAPHIDVFGIQGNTEKVLLLSRHEGRTSVLRYIMLRKDARNFESVTSRRSAPLLEVCDDDGVDIVAGLCDTLPKNGRLSVVSEYRGHIDVYDLPGEFLLERQPLESGDKTRIYVSYGRRYRIFQGLDCIYEIEYNRKDRLLNVSDEQHLRHLQNCKGQRISIPHSFGSIAAKLEKMPLTRLWIMKQIHLGSISLEAKDYLAKLQ